MSLGPALLSGALSTMGATLFLFFVVVIFLIEFSVFLFLVVLASIVYSIGFLMLCLALFGTQGVKEDMTLDRRKHIKKFGSWFAAKVCNCIGCRKLKKKQKQDKRKMLEEQKDLQMVMTDEMHNCSKGKEKDTEERSDTDGTTIERSNKQNDDDEVLNGVVTV